MRRGITRGFRIGVPPGSRLVPCSSNRPSAVSLAEKVEEYLHGEVKAGSLYPSLAANVHVSPIGFIPKKNRPGKFRLIVDLSSPRGGSVNDAISPAHASFSYITVRRVAELIPEGMLLAKLDLKAAYRQVPEDQLLLGIKWRGTVYCDRALPFGLRSAPIIFSAVADALAWALISAGITNLAHYLDDFLIWAPDLASCSHMLRMAIQTAARLGLPVEPSKVEGPSSTLTFLGIEIDSAKRELRLPREKLLRLQRLLRDWVGKKAATKHDLQVIIGLLNDAAQVVTAGRPFLRNLIDAMAPLRKAHYVSRLNLGCRADLAWWGCFMERWNGVGLFPALPLGQQMPLAPGALEHSWHQAEPGSGLLAGPQ